MQKTFTNTILTAIFAAASLAAVPAAAGTANAVSVQINKADLTSEAGTQRIYFRLKQAAENACQAGEGRVALKQKLRSDACAQQLMDGFVMQINSKRLRAYHQTGKNQAG